MKLPMTVSAIALGMMAACSQGSDIASPGTVTPTTPPSTGGGGTGGGGTTVDCPSGFTQDTAQTGSLTTCVVSGTILSDLTLPFVEGTAFRLDGRVDVGQDVGGDGSSGDPAVLTIEPGVTVFGNSGDDYLVVNRGSRLVADGTAAAPIIMTSDEDLDRQNDSDASNDDGGDAIGEWGGLVILGRAPINDCNTTVAAQSVDCENRIEGVEPVALFGGATPDDNSGILNYLQVRFAGNPLASGDELNGISFGGVGNATEVEFVQVHNNSDDGVEFFGGTVNVKYLVLTGNDDDSVDTDTGYQGNIQYAVIRQRPSSGDNLFEASSTTGPGVPLAERSNYNIANFTAIGFERGNALRLNEGTVGQYINGVVVDEAECFRWQDAGNDNATFEAAEDPSFNSVLFDCSALSAANSTANGTTVAPLALAADANNVESPNSLAGVLPGANETGVTPFAASSVDSFFEDTTYIGAFAPEDTETNNWAAGWTFALFSDPTCPTGTTDVGVEINDTKVCQVSGVITSDLRLTRGNIYQLDGRVDVGVDAGGDGSGSETGTLTIESGVTIFGESGDDYLVVNRGSQIFANGTASNPIVFTSEDDLTNSQVDPDNAIGEWGGVVILGRAPINDCNTTVAAQSVGCENRIEGVEPVALFGGATSDDNSGTLRYVQVKHAGNPLASGDELNGISFGGVGDATQVEFVQVHNNSDDGVEFFGGTVNVRYLVLTGNDDDSVDTDTGYQGNIQFAIITQRPNSGDNLFEASSTTGPGVPLAERSNYNISNFTAIGFERGNGLRLNEGTVGQYMNGVVVEEAECFRWQDAGNDNATFEAAEDPSFNSVLFDCSALSAANSTANGTTVAPLALAADANNIETTNTLTSTFINGATEAGVTAFDASTVDPFFIATDYIGAVEDASDTWWQGWSCGLEASDPC
ncbi:MAG: hypothetical protein HRT80_02155 [Henriciella sp.]|nr:hypothetical protein [Henriciella sp.]